MRHARVSHVSALFRAAGRVAHVQNDPCGKASERRIRGLTKDATRLRGRGLVFPGIQEKMVAAPVFGRLLNDLKIDCSPHGFRSSFRSWLSDKGIHRELVEQALAHAVGSQVEQCYARSDVLERRRGSWRLGPPFW